MSSNLALEIQPRNSNVLMLVSLACVACCAALTVASCGGDTMAVANAQAFGTWVWRGTSWTHLARGSAVPRPSGDLLLYWPEAGGLVTLDGQSFDGTKWVPTQQLTNPDPGPSIIDQDTGTDPGEPTWFLVDPALNELLELDPNTETVMAFQRGIWRTVVPPTDWPKARYLRGATYNPLGRNVLFLTCCAPGEATDQTWIWDGRTLTSRQSIPGTSGYALVPDGSGRILAIGAQDAYAWDGDEWVSVATSPPSPGLSNVAYDPQSDQVIGIGFGPDLAQGTWEWGTHGWQQVHTPGPPAGAMSNPVFDPQLGGLVLTVYPQAAMGALP